MTYVLIDNTWACLVGLTKRVFMNSSTFDACISFDVVDHIYTHAFLPPSLIKHPLKFLPVLWKIFIHLSCRPYAFECRHSLMYRFLNTYFLPHSSLIKHPQKLLHVLWKLFIHFSCRPCVFECSAWNKYFVSAGHSVQQSALHARHSQFVSVFCIWYTIEIWKPAGHCDWRKTNLVGHTWNRTGQWPMTGGYFMHWVDIGVTWHVAGCC